MREVLLCNATIHSMMQVFIKEKSPRSLLLSILCASSAAVCCKQTPNATPAVSVAPGRTQLTLGNLAQADQTVLTMTFQWIRCGFTLIAMTELSALSAECSSR